MAEMVKALRDGVVTDMFHAHVPPESVEEQWDIAGLETDLHVTSRPDMPLRRSGWKRSRTCGEEALLERIIEASRTRPTRRKSAQVDRDAIAHTRTMRSCCRSSTQHWREHLAALDYLRQGIHLRGYAQKNPKQEYKREAFELFGAMLETVKHEGHVRPHRSG